MSQPSCNRGLQLPLKPLGHIQKGRSARAAIEIFVTAAHRQIGTHSAKINLDGACAMTQVPYHQRTALLGAARDRRHVVFVAGLVVNMSEQNRGDIVVDGVQHLPRLDCANRDVRQK
jgi:hypothetical protein